MLTQRRVLVIGGGAAVGLAFADSVYRAWDRGVLVKLLLRVQRTTAADAEAFHESRADQHRVA